MSTNSSRKISPLEPLGGLQRIRINVADAWFCALMIFLWSELCHRSISQSYGFSPELTTESFICDGLRFILSTATNLGLNIVGYIELGHDFSIFHKVIVPSNDCESFALTALFALCFFSLRRFIGQGVVFLIIPAFNYYVGLLGELFVAVVDEIMYPSDVVAGMHRHRQQVTPLPLTPVEILTSREPCLNKIQPTQAPSSRAGPSPDKNKENVAIRQSKTSPNSARPGPSTTPSRSYRLDESPLNREETRLCIEVVGIKNALSIQSQPKWRGFFRMNIPLYLAELRSQVSTPGLDSEKAPIQEFPIRGSTTATVSLATLQSNNN
jgi:hypothetical protein